MTGKKMGRPTLPDGQAKSVVFTLRLTKDEQAMMASAASALGLRTTEWARTMLLHAASMASATRLKKGSVGTR